jgi:putative colanic acid biosynthesis UDP-glucose lipid carrier transferase
MVAAQTGRYSKYIRPISVVFDLAVITGFSLFFFRELRLDNHYYILFQIAAWLLIAYVIKFYSIYRFTPPVEIFSKLVKQGIIFLLVAIAYFPFSKQSIFSGRAIAVFMTVSFSIITFSKFMWFYYLKKYRIVTGSNFRSAVIIGYTPEAIRLKEVFMTRNDYGYRFMAFFSDKKANPNIQGKVDALKPYVLENNVDEIYCSLNEISNEQLKDLVDFADENNKSIKFIPDKSDFRRTKYRL